MSLSACTKLGRGSNLAQRGYLGDEGSLLGPEPDNDPPGSGFDDLPDPEPGMSHSLPGLVGRLSRDCRLRPSPPGQGYAPSPAARGVSEGGHRARLVLVGDLREEARWHPVLALAPAGAQLGVRERERLPRARDPNVGQPPLLFEVVLVERTSVREGPFFHPDDEDVRELEPLGIVERHQRHPAALRGQRVLVRIQGLLLQKALERRLGLDALVLPGGVYELLEVLQARLGLDRVLRFQFLLVARLVESGPDQLRRWHLPRGHPQPLEEVTDGPAGLLTSARQAGSVCLRQGLVE